MKAKRAQLLAGALGALVAVVCLMVPLVFPWYHTHVATYAHCGTSTSRHLFYQYFHCSCGNNWSLCHPTQTQKSALLQRNLDAVLATDINEFESWWATCGASGTEMCTNQILLYLTAWLFNLCTLVCTVLLMLCFMAEFSHWHRGFSARVTSILSVVATLLSLVSYFIFLALPLATRHDMGSACPPDTASACTKFAGGDSYGPTSGWNAIVIASPFVLFSTMMGFVAHDVRSRYIRL